MPAALLSGDGRSRPAAHRRRGAGCVAVCCYPGRTCGAQDCCGPGPPAPRWRARAAATGEQGTTAGSPALPVQARRGSSGHWVWSLHQLLLRRALEVNKTIKKMGKHYHKSVVWCVRVHTREVVAADSDNQWVQRGVSAGATTTTAHLVHVTGAGDANGEAAVVCTVS